MNISFSNGKSVNIKLDDYFGIYNEILSSELNENFSVDCQFASSFGGHGANQRTTFKLSHVIQIISII